MTVSGSSSPPASPPRLPTIRIRVQTQQTPQTPLSATTNKENKEPNV